MAEEATKTVRLQVAGAKGRDVGTGMARLSGTALQELGLHEGDVIEVVARGVQRGGRARARHHLLRAAPARLPGQRCRRRRVAECAGCSPFRRVFQEPVRISSSSSSYIHYC